MEIPESNKRDGSFSDENTNKRRSTKGIAQLKPEYIVSSVSYVHSHEDEEPSSERFGQETQGTRKKKGKRGQNKNRDNRQVKEDHQLCPKIIQSDFGSNSEGCQFGDKCRYLHDVKEYLSHKSPEVECAEFQICPVFENLGYCHMGFKCKFLSTHCDMNELKLVKKSKDECVKLYDRNHEVNCITFQNKSDLIKKRFPFTKSEYILEIIEAMQQEFLSESQSAGMSVPETGHGESELDTKRQRQRDLYNEYHDTRYFAHEKRKLDLFHKNIVSPLTTVGNLPFRRLMKELGADITYSEMALSVPLIQGTNSEWALPKAHCSEIPGFGVQIACSKPWQATKATEALVSNLSELNEINLNSGCPIDLLYRQGSGSALLDNPARLIRCLNGMNYVSQDVPITVKMRTGTREGHPVAINLVKRLVMETDVSAITLHGRTRQQRYTKLADWDYINKVANSLRDNENERLEKLKDSRESSNRIQFIGNGDVNNWEDWYKYLENKNIDGIMVARGVLIKPWMFEEIKAQQYLDKSSTERLEILKNYSRYAMHHWGTDEYGLSQCRRFFCEFMSFFHRYVPMGICERYPVLLNERPPNWRGRNELETLLGSTDVKDWIQLSELFFGKTNEHFVFMPKHKSNSFNNKQ